MLAIHAPWLFAAAAIAAVGVALVVYLVRRLGPPTTEQERVLRFREEARKRLNRIIG